MTAGVARAVPGDITTAATTPNAPGDLAALAVHIMTNTAITGATYDIDGGQRYID